MLISFLNALDRRLDVEIRFSTQDILVPNSYPEQRLYSGAHNFLYLLLKNPQSAGTLTMLNKRDRKFNSEI